MESMTAPLVSGKISTLEMHARSLADYPQAEAPQGDYGRQFDPEYLDVDEIHMLREQVAASISANERRKKEMATPQTPSEVIW